ncbi:MAG: HD domain-containing protein [Deltaproteobacteria bacterium]|nr:HD domain-containing protein [Deltaproteobacteria bacterium]
MIRKALLLKIFDAAYMHRWNDQLRPIEFIELDKQAHKMVIAYFLGKFEESKKDFNWIEIIEGGIFELLQRIVVTDLKPPVFYKIKDDPKKYKLLNDWVFGELKPFISPLGNDFCERFKSYFVNSDENLNRRILYAAHYYASKWEFDIIATANPGGYEIDVIRRELVSKEERYDDLLGMEQLKRFKGYKDFIDLCGRLRYQSRWAHLYRVPKTSVLGHTLYVAILSYLFSYILNACEKRCFNNYFTGLFHDLPEVLTRDIISPVKRSIEGLSELIKEYENEQMEKEVYALIPKQWHKDIKLFTENEFENTVVLNGKRKKVKGNEIGEKYNEDRFNPRDGELIKALDDLAAFIEAYAAIHNGASSKELHKSIISNKEKYEGSYISGINFGEIYADFD